MAKRIEYSIDSVQAIVDTTLPGYKVLDLKRKPVGNKNDLRWMVLMKCPNEAHPPYWTQLYVVKKGHPCRKCIEETEYLTPRKYKIVLDACQKIIANSLNWFLVVKQGSNQLY